MKIAAVTSFNYNNRRAKTSQTNFKAKGIYPGSFDPITNGHLDIINRARKFLDSVIVAVGINPEKIPFLTPKQRVNLIKKSVKSMENVAVESYEGMTVDFAKEKNADIMVRGVRNQADYEFEQKVIEFNRGLNPNIDTVILQTNPTVENISSSLVRKSFAEGKDISSLVPEPVKQTLFLKQNLETSLKNIGAESETKTIFNDFMDAYDTTERGYHGLDHIENMLLDFNKVQESGIGQKVKNTDAFRYSVFMHDFRNGTPNDVAESIDYAISSAKNLRSADSEYVKKLISATDYSYNPEITSFDEALMQDLDLAVLGRNHEEYQKYAKAIRREYGKFDDSIYNPERIKVLQNFLEKENIYNTDYFRDNFEKTARENIQSEIQSLLFNISP